MKALTAMLLLFNGQNLDGWNVPSGKWVIADGAIICAASPVAAPAVLQASYESDRFTLTFQYRRGADHGYYRLVIASGPDGEATHIDLWQHDVILPLSVKAKEKTSPDAWTPVRVDVEPSLVRVGAHYEDPHHLSLTLKKDPKSRGFVRFEAYAPGIEIRDIKVSEPDFVPMMDGDSLKGWEIVNQKPNKEADWSIKDGTIICRGQGYGTWLRTLKTYDNFIIRAEYILPTKGNSGIYLRAPLQGRVSQIGLEIQLLDDANYPGVKPTQRTGSVYAGIGPEGKIPSSPANQWNAIEVLCDHQRVRTILNGVQLYDARLDDASKDAKLLDHPLANRLTSGFIGLQDHTGGPRFRNVRIHQLPPTTAPAAAN